MQDRHLIPEYSPAAKLYLNFVQDFFNSRFHVGQAIAALARAAAPLVDVEIFTAPQDLPHLLKALAHGGVDETTITITSHAPLRAIPTEGFPLLASDAQGKGVALGFHFLSDHPNYASEMRPYELFNAWLAKRLQLTYHHLGFDFATAAVAVCEEIVLVSEKHLGEGALRKHKLSTLQNLCPRQNFFAVPTLAGELTGDLDMYLWPIAAQTWIVSAYPEGSPQADSIAPTVKLLQEHGHTLHRMPGLPAIVQDDINTMPNYANGVLINQTALVPEYKCPEDDVVQGVLRDLGFAVIPIDARAIIQMNSALHCISRVIPQQIAPQNA